MSFKMICDNCGAESTAKLRVRGLSKVKEIRLEGPVQLYVDELGAIEYIECESCHNQTAIKGDA